MKKFWLLFLLIGLSAFLAGCSDGGATIAENGKEEEEIPVPVESATVTEGTVYAAYSGTTTLEADREADIVAKTSGIILKLLVEEGDRVAAGDVVAQLDDERLRLEVERADTMLRKLESEFKRTGELYGKKLISSDAYEKARFDLEQQKATVELAKLELSYSKVRSPIDGVVTERLVKEGKLINLNEPLFRVDDFDPLLAIMHVPEKQLASLRAGQTAIIEIDAMGDKKVEGRLDRISPVVDPQSGTFKATVEIDQPDPALKPGMFGRVSIVYDIHDNVPVVPRDSVIFEDAAAFVYRVSEDRAVRVPVAVGYSTGDSIEITSGLDLGQEIVTAGKGSISDDTLLDVLNRPETNIAEDQPAEDENAVSDEDEEVEAAIAMNQESNQQAAK